MKLALGTAQFGMRYGLSNNLGKVPLHEVQKMLNFARNNSIDLLDTAISYGSSEESLGHAGVTNFKVTTKLPPIPEHCVNIYHWVEEHIAASRSRISVDTLYGVLLHKASDLTGAHGRELFAALDAHRRSGEIQKVGVSIYSPQELDLINEKFSLDVVQAPFNLIDRRLHASGWLHKLKNRGIEVHARSIFLQGLLLMPLSCIPHKFNRWPDLWVRWNQWRLENAVAPIKACISFIRQFEEIDRMIVGATSVIELQEITNAFSDNFVGSFPNLESFDEMLLNPSNWDSL